jgi:hypothetical protein
MRRQFAYIYGSISGYTAKMGSVCRINILDKILITGAYFERFWFLWEQKKET